MFIKWLTKHSHSCNGIHVTYISNNVNALTAIKYYVGCLNYFLTMAQWLTWWIRDRYDSGSLIIKARSDTLKLGDRWGKNMQAMWTWDRNNKHFLLRCFKLYFVRNLYSIFKMFWIQDVSIQDVLKEILL